MNRRHFLITTGIIGTTTLSGYLWWGNNESESETEPPTESTPGTNSTESPSSDTDSSTTETTSTTESDSTETETETQTEEPIVENEDDTSTETETATESAGPNGAADYVIEVGPDGEPVFSPESLTISVTEKVKWVWRSDRHNIIPATEGNGWEGTPGADDDLYYEGYTYEHTFTSTGTFEYYCEYHDGMYAEIVVTE